jgi:hypothetical protein
MTTVGPAGAPVLAPFEDPASDCCIVIGNHRSHLAIGEAVYSLYSYFSRHYRTCVSKGIVPGKLNVIIDEFASPAWVNQLCRAKDARPETRLVLLATELVTQISVFGLTFGRSFNVFEAREGFARLAALVANRLRLKAELPYMHARYCGFVQALNAVDLVLCAHPGIAQTMTLLPAEGMQQSRPVLTLYPPIDLDRLANDRRLHQLPSGFTMTGTLTKFRRNIVSEMLAVLGNSGVRGAPYRYVAFDQSRGLRIDGQQVDFGYSGEFVATTGDRVENFLYNLNPPQRAHWPYSSPLRILRAILLGQIPVVTHKFADHDIESVALLWDGTMETAQKLWADATTGRRRLIERHLSAIADYNRVVRVNNAAIDRALQIL